MADGSINDGWNVERRALVRRTICPKGIPDDEFLLFIEQCQRSGLDPLLKQAFCVPRETKGEVLKNPDGTAKMEQGSNGKWYPCRERIVKYEFQPSEAGMLSRAERFPDFLGVEASAVYAEDEIIVDQGKGEVLHRFNPAKRKGALVGSWARVTRKEKKPVLVWLDFAAYVQGTPLWSSKPATMVEKCARVAALRKAYPETFGGLYIPGERPDDREQDEETGLVVEPEPQTRAPALPVLLAVSATTESTPTLDVEVLNQRERECIATERGMGFGGMDAVMRAEAHAQPSREPGQDDGEEPDELAREVDTIVAKAKDAATLREYRDLAKRAEALPKGSEERKYATAALKAAHMRLTEGGGK